VPEGYHSNSVTGSISLVPTKEEGGARLWGTAERARPRVAERSTGSGSSAHIDYWQQADAFWEHVWAIFPKAILWPAFMVYEGFSALGA
jgi:hypothetical protein